MPVVDCRLHDNEIKIRRYDASLIITRCSAKLVVSKTGGTTHMAIPAQVACKAMSVNVTRSCVHLTRLRKKFGSKTRSTRRKLLYARFWEALLCPSEQLIVP
jgi:hypothetical protein